MADWLNITDTQVDPDAPLTSQLAYGWRDNPIAIAEGAAGAPYVQSSWHPYNGVTVGDGNTGLILDAAVTTGLTTFTTPTFDAGWDYKLEMYGLGSTVTSFARTIAFRRDVDGVFVTFTATPASQYQTARIELLASPSGTRFHWVNYFSGSEFDAGVATRLNAIRYTASAPGFNTGKVYLYRRKSPYA